MYKLTDHSLRTLDKRTWKVGEAQASEQATFKDPISAILLDPIMANLPSPRLWEVDGDVQSEYGVIEDRSTLRLIREVEIPSLPLLKKVTFAIEMAKRFPIESRWGDWASAWLDDSDRTQETAEALSFQSSIHQFAVDAAVYYAMVVKMEGDLSRSGLQWQMTTSCCESVALCLWEANNNPEFDVATVSTKIGVSPTVLPKL